MGRSGLLTVFLLALVAVLVLLAVSRSTADLGETWGRLAGPPPDSTLAVPPSPASTARPMTGGDGARQVQQMQRDMEAMQELSRSVGR
jgi:hypothetical protein